MSMPANDTPWPPPALAPAFDVITESAAWWAGDTGTLSSQYQNRQYRDSQFAGGVVGATSRFFWGKPAIAGQQNRKMHIPLAADLASTSATLLYDTPPTFKTSEADSGSQARLDELLNTEQFAADILTSAESCAALGGVYWRLMWDKTLDDKPWVDFVDADSAIPEWRSGRLQSVTFVEELPKLDEKHVHRLLSRYASGRIDYALYEGRDNNLGRAIALMDHPTAAPIAQNLDQYSGVSTTIPGIGAGFIRNAPAGPQFRRNGQLRNFGRADLSPDLWELFDFIDEQWTDLRRELRISKGRITVPEYMLKTGGFGQGMAFDEDREVYDALKASPDQGLKPEFHQPSIRVESYLTSIEATTAEVLRRANYSPSTFGLEGKAAQMTATEIHDRYRASMQTWRSKARYQKSALAEIARDLLALDAAVFGGTTALTEAPIVEMTPPVQETKLDKAKTIQALDAARAISTYQKIEELRPEWGTDQRSEEVQRIQDETAPDTFDPLGSVGADEPADL